MQKQTTKISSASVDSYKTGLRLLILMLIGILGFSSRLFSIVRFESVIHEFDPWFDELSWYPLGRVVGGTVYPGIMVTAGLIHYILHLFNFPIDIREVCVFLAPLFSAFTAFATYLLTKELKDERAGLLAALFIAIAPGYISRSVAGSYDNEGIAIFLLMITYFYWIKALKTGSSLYGSITAFFYFYMVSAWGGYVFIINLIPLHAFALILMGRYSPRLYVSYTSFYIIGTLSSMQIPFVGFQPTFTSEHMAALGVFGLLQLVAFSYLVRSHFTEKQFKSVFRVLLYGVGAAGAGLLGLLAVTGKIAPFTGRFYSLYDTGYAKIHIPIIASVSEHQPTAWPSFFFDLHVLIPLLPAGVFLCFKRLKDEHVFVILYAVSASYFAGVMVRLMLTLTPIVCVASAMAFSELFDTYLEPVPVAEVTTTVNDSTPSSFSKSSSPKKKSDSIITSKHQLSNKGIWGVDIKYITIIPMVFILWHFVLHCTWVTSNAYSSPSIVLASRNPDGSQHIIDDFREAYYWLRENTEEKCRIMSWWDYGYQITGMANRTVLVDNNTWNNTHIATVGKMMASSEEVAYPIMRRHDVDYVLVIFGGVLGYSGDDINKFLWMIRIGEGVYPKEVNERAFFTDRGEYKVDENATPTMKNSLMYKMSYYRFPELFGQQQAVDRVRGAVIPKKPIKLSTLDEGNWNKQFL
ncbi:oligosaccharyl transferase stt3 subunit [Clydaea vesicula]|uniref:Dolichyl-diphosphooligosaccharide--protein glycosyltransferase subunit STT3 n=1 Tax=Clydaea vesicula TaxID=447962 RepID=A0AAD5UA94_9FUNG|nr:oligosaccharyl transferase stt3 subunit [Clydaea vesicula]